MIVVVCPGQGSQTPGFLEPWLQLEGFPQILARFSEAVGIDLVAHGTVSDAETIKDTAIAQPLIVAASLMSLAALGQRAPLKNVAGYAGHSVGEITAAAAAGVLSNEDALRFVSARAQAMAKAAKATPTGMSAVLGGEAADVEAHVAKFGLSPANYNGGGQIVVAGDMDGLAGLTAEPLHGTRVIPLQVAGAFHTPYMESAREILREASADFRTSDPVVKLWTNNDGSIVTDGARFMESLITQVASPVRWDKCMDSFAAAGVTGLIELSPAGALTGLARRGLKDMPTVAVKTPEDLDAAAEMLIAG